MTYRPSSRPDRGLANPVFCSTATRTPNRAETYAKVTRTGPAGTPSRALLRRRRPFAERSRGRSAIARGELVELLDRVLEAFGADAGPRRRAAPSA